MAIAPTPSLRFEPVSEPKKTITIGHIVINGVRLKVTLENVPNKSLSEAELKETLEKAHLIAATILGEPDQLRGLKKLTVNNSGYNLNGKQHDEEKEILAKDVYTQKFKRFFYEIKEKNQFEGNYSFYESYTNKDLYHLKEQQKVKISHLYQSIIQKFNEEPFIHESEIKEKEDDSSPSISPISESKKLVSGASLRLTFNARRQDPVVKPDHSERDRRESFEFDVLKEASPEPSVSDGMIKIPQYGGRLDARPVLRKGDDDNLNRELDSDSDSENEEFFDAHDIEPNGSISSSIIGINDPDSLVPESDNNPGMDSFVEVTKAKTPSVRSRSSSLIGNLDDIERFSSLSRSHSFSVLSRNSISHKSFVFGDVNEEFSALELKREYDKEVENFQKRAGGTDEASAKPGLLKRLRNVFSKPKAPLTLNQINEKDGQMMAEISQLER
ncbi:MAG: hypothetical protein EBU93_06650 [Chlamydiae bacterium]|nr:hypothetical protein [Chlamydiota bacterium]